MSDPRWLTIIGVGEDGLPGLSDASRSALEAAEIVFGAARHLVLAGVEDDRAREWPVPFSLDSLLSAYGQRVVALTSGDPFWFGAGSVIAGRLDPGEWTAHPAPSTFSLAAARLGWRLEETHCLGLHAAPFARLRRVLAPGQRVICTLRDGGAAGNLADWLTTQGYGASTLHILEALGGPRERIRQTTADAYDLTDAAHPVAVAIDPSGPALSRATGLPDDLFRHDGQITKRPVRALTLSALAPGPGEVLWDIGAGSGSVSVEFLLAAPGTRAHAVELRPDRAASIRANADAFGLSHRLTVTEGRAPEALADLQEPQAVFLGGGASEALLADLTRRLAPGTRLVANAVTLETEALLTDWSARLGGTLLRIELSEAAPLGPKRGWRAAMPVVQWSVTL